jgi:hypothetical protein
MVVAEQLIVSGTRGVIFLSDEERGMVRFYALADGKFLGTLLGNEPQCARRSDEDAKTCYRRQSLFTGNVEGMVIFGHLLALMDEGDDPLPGKEDGGVIWFFDLRDPGIFNRGAAGFAGKTGAGLMGGIHKRSPHTNRAVMKNTALAAEVPPGAFIAVANQGVRRLELFDLDRLLESLGVDAERRAALYDGRATR